MNTSSPPNAPRFVAVATIDTLPDGGLLRVMLESHALVLARRGDAVYAFQGTCPHEKADLSQGRIENDRLICPRHLASFALSDGAVSAGWDNVAALKLYPARIEGDDIAVDAAAVNRNPPGGSPQSVGSQRTLAIATRPAMSAQSDRRAADIIVAFDQMREIAHEAGAGRRAQSRQRALVRARRARIDPPQ